MDDLWAHNWSEAHASPFVSRYLTPYFARLYGWTAYWLYYSTGHWPNPIWYPGPGFVFEAENSAAHYPLQATQTENK